MRWRYLVVGTSIITATFLILTSFSNTVGYQSVKSTVNDSPLFLVRTKRSINLASGDTLTSDYLGKGEENSLQIPPYDEKTILVRKAIESIKAMDEQTFNTFLQDIVSQSTASDTYTSIEIQQLINGLRQMRLNPESFYANNNSNYQDLTWQWSPTLCWFPGCVLLYIWAFILGVIIVYTIWHGCVGPSFTCSKNIE